jgi:hypothetical protein
MSFKRHSSPIEQCFAQGVILLNSVFSAAHVFSVFTLLPLLLHRMIWTKSMTKRPNSKATTVVCLSERET